jgi:cell wall-associated NlpC family hydrolase
MLATHCSKPGATTARRLEKLSAAAVWIMLLLLFQGCAPTRRIAERQPPVTARSDAVDLEDAARVRQILYRQAEAWRGVPYRKGGLSKEGIDCSGFVYVTFFSEFGVRIPRTTRLQAAAGKNVTVRRLSAGDLVFFRTGIKGRHVGIYIDEQLFVHASTSGGVMLSRLGDAYWDRRYWKAVRIRLR